MLRIVLIALLGTTSGMRLNTRTRSHFLPVGIDGDGNLISLDSSTDPVPANISAVQNASAPKNQSLTTEQVNQSANIESIVSNFRQELVNLHEKIDSRKKEIEFKDKEIHQAQTNMNLKISQIEGEEMHMKSQFEKKEKEFYQKEQKEKEMLEKETDQKAWELGHHMAEEKIHSLLMEQMKVYKNEITKQVQIQEMVEAKRDLIQHASNMTISISQAEKKAGEDAIKNEATMNERLAELEKERDAAMNKEKQIEKSEDAYIKSLEDRAGTNQKTIDKLKGQLNQFDSDSKRVQKEIEDDKVMFATLQENERQRQKAEERKLIQEKHKKKNNFQAALVKNRYETKFKETPDANKIKDVAKNLGLHNNTANATLAAKTNQKSATTVQAMNTMGQGK